MNKLNLINFIVLCYLTVSCKIDSNRVQFCDSCADTCNSTINQFTYPEIFNVSNRLSPSCKKDPLIEKNRAYHNTNFSYIFVDDRYTVVSYNSTTRLVLDYKFNAIMCFKRISDSDLFSTKSITKIYYLNSDLMPIYAVGNHVNSDSFLLEKFDYTSQSYLTSNLIKLTKNDVSLNIDSLLYDQLIDIWQSLFNEEYVLTTTWYSYESPHFLRYPVWTE